MSRVPGAQSTGGLGAANSLSSAVPHGVEENLNDGVSSAVDMVDMGSIGRPLSNLMPGGSGVFATAGEAVASPSLVDNLAESATGRMFTEAIDGESPLEKLERNVARAVDKVTDPDQMLMVGQMTTYMTDSEEVEGEAEAEGEAENHGDLENAIPVPQAADADATDVPHVEPFGQTSPASDQTAPDQTAPDSTNENQPPEDDSDGCCGLCCCCGEEDNDLLGCGCNCTGCFGLGDCFGCGDCIGCGDCPSCGGCCSFDCSIM